MLHNHENEEYMWPENEDRGQSKVWTLETKNPHLLEIPHLYIPCKISNTMLEKEREKIRVQARLLFLQRR